MLEVEVCKIFTPLIEGLIFLKQKGVIHRDIKPDNIFVSSNYESVFGDFGTSIKVFDNP